MSSPAHKPLKNPRAAHGFRGRSCSITAVGSYVPSRVLTNLDLEKMVNTTDEWITTRTGIKERRLAAPNEYTSDLAAQAARCALERAKVDPLRGTKVIDGEGKVLIPGFVDGHTHILYYASPQEFLRFAMKGGITTIVTEIMELTFAMGYSGHIEYLEVLKDQYQDLLYNPSIFHVQQGCGSKGSNAYPVD